MTREFNVTAVCRAEENYMVDITQRVQTIKALVDDGKYFSITKARQYGKTTTLRALASVLQAKYCVVSMDFQTFGAEEFTNENVFSLSFASSFVRSLNRSHQNYGAGFKDEVLRLQKIVEQSSASFRLKQLFESLSDLCKSCNR